MTKQLIMLYFIVIMLSHKVPSNWLVEWWKNIISPNNSSPKIPEEIKSLIIATWWAIWKGHNDFIFRRKN